MKVAGLINCNMIIIYLDSVKIFILFILMKRTGETAHVPFQGVVNPVD